MSKCAASVVLAHCGSPVSDDSSTLRLRHSRISQSAGTSSPASSSTTSPTTTSLRATCRTLPLRTTLTRVSSFAVLRLWNVFSLLRSRKKAMLVANISATMMPIGSKKFLKPAPAQQNS